MRILDDLVIANIIDGKVNIKLGSTEQFLIDATTNPRTLTNGAFRINFTPSATGTRAIHIDISAGSYGDTHASFINYKPSGFIGTKDAHINDILVDSTGSTGGEVVGYAVSKIGSGSVGVVGIETYPGVIPVEAKSGTEANPIQVFTTANEISFTDITSEATNPAVDVQIWTTNNSWLYVGHTSPFYIINLYWQVFADGNGILPTFQYSIDGGGDPLWASFTPSDGTNGARNNGSITFGSSSVPGWVSGPHDNSLPPGRYWIRIKRTNASLVTPPTEDYIKTIATTTYKWDATGNVNFSTLRASGQAGFGVTSLNTSTGLELQRTHTTTGIKYGQKNFINFGNSLTDTSAKYGTYQSIVYGSNNVFTNAIHVGYHSQFDANDSGPITSLVGFQNLFSFSPEGGTITNTYGFLAKSLAILDGVGVTNNYGVYVELQSAATNNWAVYTAGTTKSYFGGAVGVGSINIGYPSTSTSSISMRIKGDTSNNSLRFYNSSDENSLFIGNESSTSAGLKLISGGIIKTQFYSNSTSANYINNGAGLTLGTTTHAQTSLGTQLNIDKVGTLVDTINTIFSRSGITYGSINANGISSAFEILTSSVNWDLRLSVSGVTNAFVIQKVTGHASIGVVPDTNILLKLSKTYSSVTGAGSYGIKNSTTYNASENFVKYGLYQETVLADNISNSQGLVGISSVMSYGTTGNSSSANVPFTNFLASGGVFTDTGNCPNWYQFKADNLTAGGTITNLYGFYVSNLTTATNNWAVYTAGTTKSYFGGRVGINKTVPTASLEIVGEGDTNATYALKVHNSSGTNNSLVVGNAGNVGIGTAPTTVKLSINEGVFSDTITRGTLTEGDCTGNVGIIGSRFSLSNTSGVITSAFRNTRLSSFRGLEIITETDHPIRFNTLHNNHLEWKTERFRITNVGNFGFGIAYPQSFFQVSQTISSDGTLSISGTSVTGVGTSFTTNMVGNIIIFSDGTIKNITSYISPTSLTVAESGTIGSQTYKIIYKGFNVNGNNVGINTSTFGTSAVGVFAQKNGTSPSTDIVDQYQLYAADIVGGNSAPHFRTENGDIIKLYKTGTGWAATNYTQRKTIDLSSFTLQELGDLVGTLIEEVHKLNGFISA